MKSLVSISQPAVYIVFGLPGSGKSYFASRWADAIKAAYLNSDVIRKELYESPGYSEEQRALVYRYLLEYAKKTIREQRSVVIDATFSDNHIRSAFEDSIQKYAVVHYIEVTADEPTIRHRLEQKRLYSDADYKVYMKLKESWQGLDRPHLVLYSTDDNIDEMLNRAKAHFKMVGHGDTWNL